MTDVTAETRDPDRIKVLAGYALRHYGYHAGPEPGSFYKALVETIGRADPQNRARLALSFPVLVGMMAAISDDPNGTGRVRHALTSGEWPTREVAQ